MYKKYFWFLTVFFVGLGLRGQTHEIGAGPGLGYYVGDLNPTFHWRFPHVGGTAFYRYNLTNHWSFRGGFVYTRVSAADSVGFYDFQASRNLSFQSDIFELHGTIEFNFFPYKPGRNRTRNFTPHMFWGLGMFHFNPQASYNGDLIDLATLGTEGQLLQGNGAAYSRIAGVMPFGIGIKYKIAPRWSVMAEWGMRFTFTDYLDDVSRSYTNLGQLVMVGGQVAADLSDPTAIGSTGPPRTNYMRGIKNDFDWYSFFHVSLVFNIKDKEICHN